MPLIACPILILIHISISAHARCAGCWQTPTFVKAKIMGIRTGAYIEGIHLKI